MLPLCFQFEATLVVMQCMGRESCVTASPGPASRPSRAARHNILSVCICVYKSKASQRFRRLHDRVHRPVFYKRHSGSWMLGNWPAIKPLFSPLSCVIMSLHQWRRCAICVCWRWRGVWAFVWLKGVHFNSLSLKCRVKNTLTDYMVCSPWMAFMFKMWYIWIKSFFPMLVNYSGWRFGH